MSMTITEKVLADHAAEPPLPAFAREIIAAGGLVQDVARKQGLSPRA